MNILMLSYEYPPLGGGGAKVVYGLANTLAGAGHAVDVVTMGFRGLPRRETAGSVTIHRVPCVRLRIDICSALEMLTYIISALFVLYRVLKEKRYDIIHTHFIYPDGIISCLIKATTKVPFIVTAHGSDVPGYNPDRFKMLHACFLWLWKHVVSSISVIVCPSESIRSLVLKSKPDANVALVPYGFTCNKFDPYRTKEKRILIVTRMFERKGVQYVLEALVGLDHGYEVNIVGDGPYLDILKKRAGDLNVKARFMGFMDNNSNEFKDLYETSKLFIFTSEQENFPVVLLEAMSARMAIITTEGTGCQEVVGDTALLVPVCDAAAIRGALDRLINDDTLCGKLADAAHKRIKEYFNWDVVMKAYVALYEKYRRAEPL
jgi:glycosyltransferase involved in cell wall biosynthesis